MRNTRKPGRHSVNGRSGFTLLEVVIATGIIALLSVVLVQTFITAARSNTKTELLKDIKQNGDFALGIMVRMIHNSTAVTSSCASGGTSLASLTISNPDSGKTTFVCSSDGTAARIASVSGTTTTYLTSNTVSLGGANCSAATLAFVCTTVGGKPDHINVSFTLSQVGTAQSLFAAASDVFDTTVTVRND
ncbi:prepilin-type N-terminal cleavage/methylation domain-containing protein [Patescibacteria group bacterium]|nr:prepilin-type N-terminal cleavage/methylation domain-containing protein [Patescibacteria group bacterium]